MKARLVRIFACGLAVALFASVGFMSAGLAHADDERYSTPIEVIWENEKGDTSGRPFQIYADLECINAPGESGVSVLSPSNSWKVTATPKKKSHDGTELQFKLHAPTEEDTPYWTVVTGDVNTGFKIRAIKSEVKTLDISVVWEDDNNAQNKRPSLLTINTKPEWKTGVLTDTDDWKKTYTYALTDAELKPMSYDGIVVDGGTPDKWDKYDYTIKGDMTSGYVITARLKGSGSPDAPGGSTTEDPASSTVTPDESNTTVTPGDTNSAISDTTADGSENTVDKPKDSEISATTTDSKASSHAKSQSKHAKHLPTTGDSSSAGIMGLAGLLALAVGVKLASDQKA